MLVVISFLKSKDIFPHSALISILSHVKATNGYYKKHTSYCLTEFFSQQNKKYSFYSILSEKIPLKILCKIAYIKSSNSPQNACSTMLKYTKTKKEQKNYRFQIEFIYNEIKNKSYVNHWQPLSLLWSWKRPFCYIQRCLLYYFKCTVVCYGTKIVFT